MPPSMPPRFIEILQQNGRIHCINTDHIVAVSSWYHDDDLEGVVTELTLSNGMVVDSRRPYFSLADQLLGEEGR